MSNQTLSIQLLNKLLCKARGEREREREVKTDSFGHHLNDDSSRAVTNKSKTSTEDLLRKRFMM